MLEIGMAALLSAQDGSIKVWEWLTGKLLGSTQVGQEVMGGGANASEVEAVTKVCCSSQDPAFVVTSLEKLVTP